MGHVLSWARLTFSLLRRLKRLSSLHARFCSNARTQTSTNARFCSSARTQTRTNARFAHTYTNTHTNTHTRAVSASMHTPGTHRRTHTRALVAVAILALHRLLVFMSSAICTLLRRFHHRTSGSTWSAVAADAVSSDCSRSS